MKIEILRRMFHRSACRLERISRFDHLRMGFGHDGLMYNYLDRAWLLTCDGVTVCLLWKSDLIEGRN